MVEEGFRSRPYKDRKQLTYGYGTKAPNLSAIISPRDAEIALEKEIKRTIKEYYWLEKKCPFVINEVRREALCDMIFNLGFPTFRTFKKSIKLILNDDDEDWHFVAAEMRDSDWFDQVRKRAERILYEIDTGEFKNE